MNKNCAIVAILVVLLVSVIACGETPTTSSVASAITLKKDGSFTEGNWHWVETSGFNTQGFSVSYDPVWGPSSAYGVFWYDYLGSTYPVEADEILLVKLNGSTLLFMAEDAKLYIANP